MKQREGSPFTGLSVVAFKEAADHMTSPRMHLVMLLVILTALGSIYGAIGDIKHRITSYNVCYTKLLRHRPVGKLDADDEEQRRVERREAQRSRRQARDHSAAARRTPRPRATNDGLRRSFTP